MNVILMQESCIDWKCRLRYNIEKPILSAVSIRTFHADNHDFLNFVGRNLDISCLINITSLDITMISRVHYSDVIWNESYDVSNHRLLKFFITRLQWSHMNAMTFQITGNWCLVTRFSALNLRNDQSTTILCLCGFSPKTTTDVESVFI